MLVKSKRNLLKAFERVLAVGGVNLVQVRTESLHLREHADWELARTLQLHDVHFRSQVLGKVPMDPEGNLAVDAFERSWVRGRRRPERCIDVDLVEMSD